MTTIVVTPTMMVADTMVSFEERGIFYPTQKIFRINGELVGARGHSGNCLRMLEWAKSGWTMSSRPKFEKVEEDDNDSEGLYDTDVLIVNKQGIFYFCPEYPQPEEILFPFFAVGSGGKCAMGAMKAGADPIKAVQIAAEVDLWTGPPIHILYLAGGDLDVRDVRNV